MALIFAVLTFLALCGFCLGFAALGNLFLRLLRFRLPSASEHALLAAALGLITTEIAVFLIQRTNHIRPCCFGLAAVLFSLAIKEGRPLWQTVRAALEQIPPATRLNKILLVLISVVLGLLFLSSQAPLTGSDALNYHFTVQKQILENGFHPIFWLSPSFLTGQHHLLILLGLALQGERLALGFVFLGGVLATLALLQLILRWACVATAMAFGLLFLLTPVVFWQISVAGTPDVYMAFLACVAVLVLSHEQEDRTWQQVVIAGFLVGGIAGGKYTGCLVAAAFLIAATVEFKSLAGALLFALASLLSGIWPYLRNFVWTSDPVFPFLGLRLAPHLVTKFGMSDLVAETGASSAHRLLQLIPFVTLAAAQQDNAGLFDFFGPVVLALAPLILLAFKNTRAWRVPLLVWSISGVGIFYASGLPRFLLPIFPIALSCVAGGWEASAGRNWRIAHATATLLIVAMIAVGGAGLAMYSARPLLAACGLLRTTQYLQESAPDYQVVETINRFLAGEDPQMRTLLFVRHSYYLRIPYINGDPGTSFEVDPDLLGSTTAWKDFFDKKRIAYVVRAPNYPPAIAQPLLEMERDGDLIPVGQGEAENFSGKRIAGVRAAIKVMVFKVKR